jgi:hypothetical protein
MITTGVPKVSGRLIGFEGVAGGVVTSAGCRPSDRQTPGSAVSTFLISEPASN